MSYSPRNAWRTIPLLLTIVAAVIGSPGHAFSQDLDGVSVRGTVRDPAGLPVADALVTVSDANTGFSRVTPTARDGRFLVRFPVGGRFDVRIEKVGYNPLRIDGVTVGAGGGTELTATLSPAGGAPIELQTVSFGSIASTRSWPVLRREFPPLIVNELPDVGRDITDLLEWSTAATGAGSIEGLPIHLSRFVLDGVPVSTVMHPDPGNRVRLPHLPVSALSAAGIATNVVDIEWSGAAAGQVGAATYRGARELGASAFGTWSADALSSSRHFNPGDVPHSAVHARLRAEGPVIRDSATLIAGIEARRIEAVQAAVWHPGRLTPLLAEALEDAGVTLDGYITPSVTRDEALTGFGRFDWTLAGRHMVSTTIALASVDATASRIESNPTFARGSALAARNASVVASLSTDLNDRFSSRTRVGISRSSHKYEALPGQSGARTIFVAEGIGLGVSPGAPGEFQETSAYLRQSAHYLRPSHELKFGVDLDVRSHERIYATGRVGEFTFGGAGQFLERAGLFRQAVGPQPPVSWTVPAAGAFVQDTWHAAPGLDVTAGVRVDGEWLPVDKIRLNTSWRDRTRLENTNVERTLVTISPRFGVRWDVQERSDWLVEVATGIYAGRVDPAVFGELLAEGGHITVRRGIGEFSTWPSLPPEGGTSATGARLTLLGPEFRAPQTLRASAGIARRIGTTMSLYASAVARRTDYLPRRVDLNRVPGAIARDQHGRPIYGHLVQRGSLIAASPETTRRFAGFDLVSAINADGRSEYRGLTVGVEGSPYFWLDVSTSYTYSKTTDNWAGAAGDAVELQLSPFPDRLDGRDWLQGTSDFDVPHRFVAAAGITLPTALAPRLTVAYSYRSGAPFTPGFPAGVDVNGDGSGHNDPAFVAEDVDGIQPLLAKWDCLAVQIGSFVSRNSCRGPAAHTLDVRFAVQVLNAGRYRAGLVLDGVNLLDPELPRVDRALYQIDHDGELQTGDNGTVVLPLVANPNFGEPLGNASSGRILRLGLEITY